MASSVAMAHTGLSPLAEGRELKFIYAAIMSAVAIVAPRGGA